jgi:hypothetical protein
MADPKDVFPSPLMIAAVGVQVNAENNPAAFADERT